MQVGTVCVLVRGMGESGWACASPGTESLHSAVAERPSPSHLSVSSLPLASRLCVFTSRAPLQCLPLTFLPWLTGRETGYLGLIHALQHPGLAGRKPRFTAPSQSQQQLLSQAAQRAQECGRQQSPNNCLSCLRPSYGAPLYGSRWKGR